MSHLFASGDQSIGVSALASFLPKKSQGWSPSEWTGWISLGLKILSLFALAGLSSDFGSGLSYYSKLEEILPYPFECLVQFLLWQTLDIKMTNLFVFPCSYLSPFVILYYK